MSDAEPRTVARAAAVWTVGVLGVAVIALVDYLSGAELRVYPLYYAPISVVAWYHGRSGALIVAALCALSWLGSNALAGLRFSHAGIWAANGLMQAASFTVVGGLIATLRDSLARERRLSRIDPLTSLLNTRAFYEDATRILALCRRNGQPVTAAYIDLDDFKSVNDRLGHQRGDELLRSVGSLLRASLRSSDLCARLGGDEFVILLPEVGPDEARATLARLGSLLEEIVPPGRAPVTSSIGGVTFITTPDKVEDVVQQIDAHMYVAKAAGKNRVCFEIAR